MKIPKTGGLESGSGNTPNLNSDLQSNEVTKEVLPPNQAHAKMLEKRRRDFQALVMRLNKAVERGGWEVVIDKYDDDPTDHFLLW